MKINNDDQQFYQYQQDKQSHLSSHLSPLTPNHWKQNRPQHIALEFQILACDSSKNVIELNLLVGPQ
jgi:hypothetical protein